MHLHFNHGLFVTQQNLAIDMEKTNIVELISTYNDTQMTHRNTLTLSERYQNSDHVSQQVLEQIKQLKLSSNPIHYTVLYEWLINIDPELTEKVEKALHSDRYTDQRAETLYLELISQFLCRHTPCQEVETLVNQLRQHITTWLDNTKNNHKTIVNELDLILQDDISSAIEKRITQAILPAFNEVRQETQRLEKAVTDSATEIEQLKKELEQANRIAKTDDLTGIPNRRGFNEIIENLISSAQEEQSSFALILFDLDLFKFVNDTYGHIIGDSVLRYVAKLLKEETKGRDSIARIGGEEFIALLPNTDYLSALKVAENIRIKIASKTLNVKNHSEPLKLTISSGVAIYKMGEDLDQIMRRADDALYLAKNSGRNQVCGEDRV